MIRFQPVVEIFDLPVLNVLVRIARLLERTNRFSVSLILVAVDRLGRAVLAQLQSLREFAVRRGDSMKSVVSPFLSITR